MASISVTTASIASEAHVLGYDIKAKIVIDHKHKEDLYQLGDSPPCEFGMEFQS